MALEGRPGAMPLSGSPLKLNMRRSSAQSPAKAPLPRGLDSIRQGITLIQSCTATHIRDGVALLSASSGSAQLSSSAIIMGALEALISAAASILPSSQIGMTELHSILSQALVALLDGAPASSHAAARAVTVIGAVLQKHCASQLLLSRVLATLLQRADIRLEAIRQQLSSSICNVYLQLIPDVDAAAQALLSKLSDNLHIYKPQLSAGPMQINSGQDINDCSRSSLNKQVWKSATAFGSPHIVEATQAGFVHDVVKNEQQLPPAVDKARCATGTSRNGSTGYVAHIVSSFDAKHYQNEAGYDTLGSSSKTSGGSLSQQASPASSASKESFCLK